MKIELELSEAQAVVLAEAIVGAAEQLKEDARALTRLTEIHLAQRQVRKFVFLADTAALIGSHLGGVDARNS